MKWFLLAGLLLLAACGQESAVPLFPDPVPDQMKVSESNGLSLTLASDLFTGSPSVIQTTLSNESGKSVEYGGYFAIEMKREGMWHALDHSDAVFYSDPEFRDSGQWLKDGQNVRQSCSITALGENLKPGEYRLVKTFIMIEPSYREVTVAAPFIVK